MAIWSTKSMLASGAAMVWVVCATPAMAQQRTFYVPAQSAANAIPEFARQAGVQIIAAGSKLRGKRTSTVKGQMDVRAALQILIDGTGLRVATDNGATIVLAEGNGTSDSGSSPDVAIAQTDTGAQVDTTEASGDIIVTATKSRQRLIDVPASITAENAAQLRRRGATQLQDIVEATPGLSNAGAGAGNSANLVIRGVTTDTALTLKQSTVAVLFDDIPVDPATASVYTTNLRIVDIERVEVLRGPQGTLFGSGAISGAVRYITNKPDATRFSGSIEGSFAGTSGGANSQWGNLVLNVPLVTDRVAVRAVGYGFDEGGWVDNIRLNHDNVNRNKTYGGRISIAADATDNLTLALTGAYQNSHDYATGASLYAQPSDYDIQVTNGRYSESRVKSALANLAVTYSFGSVSLFSSSTYIRRKVENLFDHGYYVNFLQLTQGIPGLSVTQPGRIYNNSDIYTQELRLASDGAGPFRWTFGGFYLRSDTPEGGQTMSVSGLTPYVGTDDLVNVSSPGRQEEISGFGEATYRIHRKLDLTAGVRVSRTTLDITSISTGLLVSGGPAVLTFNLPERETSVNPRVSVLYHPTSQVSVYAQAARGYRVGGANLTAGIGGPGIPRTYASDNLWNYEVGVKTSLMGGRLQINADVYYIDWNDLQVALLSSNNFNYTGNAGAAGIYGAELEVAAKPTSWLDLGGSLSLNDAALTQDAPALVRTTGIVGAKNGDRLPGSPRVQGSAYAQLNFKYKGDTAFVRASGQYVGSSYTDFDSKGIRFGDYGTVDLRAGIVHGNVELTIFARNLLDGDGIRSATPEFSLGPILGAAQYAYRIRPRTIGLTGRVSF
jgi:iron complex outermembrane receptor protein